MGLKVEHKRPHATSDVPFLVRSGVEETSPPTSDIDIFRTLHKQGMYGGQALVRRTLVITPGSLVKVPYRDRFVSR